MSLGSRPAEHLECFCRPGGRLIWLVLVPASSGCGEPRFDVVNLAARRRTIDEKHAIISVERLFGGQVEPAGLTKATRAKNQLPLVLVDHEILCEKLAGFDFQKRSDARYIFLS